MQIVSLPRVAFVYGGAARIILRLLRSWLLRPGTGRGPGMFRSIRGNLVVMAKSNVPRMAELRCASTGTR
jgi:hypothetical protein